MCGNTSSWKCFRQTYTEEVQNIHLQSDLQRKLSSNGLSNDEVIFRFNQSVSIRNAFHYDDDDDDEEEEMMVRADAGMKALLHLFAQIPFAIPIPIPFLLFSTHLLSGRQSLNLKPPPYLHH